MAALGGLDLYSQDGRALRLVPFGHSLRAGSVAKRVVLSPSGIHDHGDVVGGRVSPGAEDGESVFGGAGHEEELGPFAALFVVFQDVGGVVWHWGSLGAKAPLCFLA